LSTIFPSYLKLEQVFGMQRIFYLSFRLILNNFHFQAVQILSERMKSFEIDFKWKKKSEIISFSELCVNEIYWTRHTATSGPLVRPT